MSSRDFPFLLVFDIFFSNAIDIDAVIIVINIMVLMVLSVLLTEIKDEKIFLKLKEMMNR